MGSKESSAEENIYSLMPKQRKSKVARSQAKNAPTSSSGDNQGSIRSNSEAKQTKSNQNLQKVEVVSINIFGADAQPKVRNPPRNTGNQLFPGQSSFKGAPKRPDQTGISTYNMLGSNKKS